MGILSNLFKKDYCTDKNSKYYGYQNDLKEWCEHRDKYQPLIDKVAFLTEKINYFYSDFINTNNNISFDNLYKYCLDYIEILPNIEEMNREGKKLNKDPYCSNYCIAYHKLAMAYEKSECYNSAINICKEAISKGYTDKTKGGFEARLKRLEKKKNSIK